MNNYKISKRQIRPILLKLQNHKCLMCNSQFSHIVPHEIHHVDHNSSNNTFHNFAALCANCHASHHRYNTLFPIKKHSSMLARYDNTST